MGDTGYEQHNKSVYCDYNEAFKGYDKVRIPHGAKELLNIFSQYPTSLQEQAVLEGGFGTGAYLEVLKDHVGELYGVEGSDQGLKKACEKTQDSTNVFLQLGDILDLPFEDGFFDAYMVNQVLHHLDSGPPFDHMDIFIDESRRVLKFGGHISINTCSQAQLNPDYGAYWHYKYIPETAKVFGSYYMPLGELVQHLESRKFKKIKKTIPSENIFNDEYYENPEVALDPNFKKGDSIYSRMSKSELEKADNLLKKAIEDGSVYTEMKRAAERAREIGETIILSAIKSD